MEFSNHLIKNWTIIYPIRQSFVKNDECPIFSNVDINSRCEILLLLIIKTLKKKEREREDRKEDNEEIKYLNEIRRYINNNYSHFLQPFPTTWSANCALQSKRTLRFRIMLYVLSVLYTPFNESASSSWKVWFIVDKASRRFWKIFPCYKLFLYVNRGVWGWSVSRFPILRHRYPLEPPAAPFIAMVPRYRCASFEKINFIQYRQLSANFISLRSEQYDRTNLQSILIRVYVYIYTGYADDTIRVGKKKIE